MGSQIFSVALRITGPQKSLDRCFDMIESEDFPENFEFELCDEERSTVLKDNAIEASFDYCGDEWPTYIPELISDNIPDLSVSFRICKEEDVPLKFIAGIYKSKVLSNGYYWESEEDEGSEFGPDSRVAWSGDMPIEKAKPIKKPNTKR